MSQPAKRTWTKEQLQNVATYGLCWCGEPREAAMSWTMQDDGTEICSYGLICPNGHEQ